MGTYYRWSKYTKPGYVIRTKQDILQKLNVGEGSSTSFRYGIYISDSITVDSSGQMHLVENNTYKFYSIAYDETLPINIPKGYYIHAPKGKDIYDYDESKPLRFGRARQPANTSFTETTIIETGRKIYRGYVEPCEWVYTEWRDKTFVEYVYSENASAYPNGGNSGGYYYDQRTTVISPTNPSSITFGTPKAGKSLTITAGAFTDVVGSGSLTYVFERQIDNGSWTQVAATYNKTITDGVPGSGEYINYRVKARDKNGVESNYYTGTKKPIEYPIRITDPGIPQYKYPTSGKEMLVTWDPSAVAEEAPLTYIVEKQIDSEPWSEVARVSENSYTFTVPEVDAEGKRLTIRVKATDNGGNESKYSTGKATEILYHKVTRLIPWNFGTDFRVRQFTKNSRSQYQTMLAGSTAEIIATGNLRLGDMPLETLIRFGKIYNEPITWKIADKNHEGYPNNSVSFVNVYGLRGICFDAKEPNNPVKHAVDFGNADYRISNAHSWLNSDKPAGQWYTPRHEYDAPPDKNNVFFTQGMPVNPYNDFPGFLYGFTEKEKNSIMETNFLVVVPKEKDTTEVASIRSKIALISRYELNGGDGLSLKDGTPFPIFKGNLSRQIYLTQTCVVKSNYMYNHSTEKPNDYWMRGCMADESTTGRWFGFKCNNDGSLVTSAHPSNLACHVTAMPFRCVLNISADTLLNPNPNPDGSYNIVWE